MKMFGLILFGGSGIFSAFCWFIINNVDWTMVDANSGDAIYAGVIAGFTLISLALMVIGFFVFIYGVINDKLFKNP